MKAIALAAGLAALLFPVVAAAHITASPAATPALAYSMIGFRVGHGCSTGAATTALRVEIPAAIEQVRARPIPGWRVALEKSPDGRTTAVTWRGRLTDDQFEVFEILFRAPGQTGPLDFPATQTCGAASVKWTEIPGPGETAADLAHPAPRVTVTPAAGGGH